MRNLILSALILASAFQTAKAEQSGEWTYSVENNQATIIGYTGAGGAVTIPSSVNGIPVVQIGASISAQSTPVLGWYNNSVTSVIIPNGVMRIGINAFLSYANLTSVKLPSSLANVGAYAFSGCNNLPSVVLPSKQTTIGNSAIPTSTAVFYADQFLALANNDVFVKALANNDIFVAEVANKIKEAGGNYGIATQSGLSSVVEPLATKNELAPLATKAELTSSLTQSRTDGINSVLSNPNLWTLYTTSQIQNMAVDDLVLTRQEGGGFVLNYDIEQSTDLQNWTPYQALSLPMTNLPTDKAFVRIKAKQ